MFGTIWKHEVLLFSVRELGHLRIRITQEENVGSND